MRPSRLLLQALLVWLLLGAVSAFASIFEWPWDLEMSILFWGYIVALVIYASLDFLAQRKPELEVHRELEPHLALGVRHWVKIRVTNHEARNLDLWLTDFPSAKLKYEGLPVSLKIEAGHFAELSYAVTARQRGPAEFAPVVVRVLSPQRLWETSYHYGETRLTRIYPNYKPLFRTSFVGSEQFYVDLGLQLRQRRGEGTDFHQLRDFRVGDSLRQIDWRATARFNKPISREYQEERDQQVVFLLDCGRRMRAQDGDISHFDHALNALLISAFVALRQGDSVGLLSFAGQSRWVPPIKGRFQISQLLEQIYDLQSAATTTDYLEVAERLMKRQTRRSLVILISSLEPEDRDDLTRAARLLSRHHLVMVASMRQQMLTETLDNEVVTMDDALRYCGVNRHLENQSTLFTQLRSDNIIVADTAPAYMHSKLVNEYMSLKRSGIF